MIESWPWLTLALLGAYHGLNPAMGWLFAVALGLQERSRAAVLRAFAPITLGHAASIALAVVLVVAAQAVVTPESLRIGSAILLILFAVYKLRVPLSHPRWVGMRVGFRDLTLWSFLMATAHGAGLMLVPVLLRLAPSASAHAGHATHDDHLAVAGAAGSFTSLTELAAVATHTVAMLLVMALIAVLVYERLGVQILRRGWLNLDRIWAGALLVTGVLALVF
jgi:hypothetical protein